MDALTPAPVVLGVDPGAPEGDRTVTIAQGRNAGTFRLISDVEARSFAQVRAQIERGEQVDARKRRTAQEMARAFAIQQPQGLGLLFPKLRNG